MKEKMKSCWFICLFLVPKFYIVVAEDKYCEAIEKLQYGDIVTSKQPPYTVGTILTYKCDRGYRIQGKHIVTCLEDRKWSDPAPYCIALSCKRDLSMIEAERKCRKPCQKDADCKGGNKRCVCDDWCGKSCFNPSAPCPALLHPENGYIIGKEFSYGKTVTYGCDQGFVLTGPTTRKCRSNRKWSGHVPNCIALSTCGQTDQKEKSMLYGKVILGTEVQIGAWPWQILLFTNKKYHTTQIYDPNSGFGGGSIINNKWILSAAHVFYERFPMGFFKKDWKKRFLIAVGMTKHPMPGEVIPDRINIFEPQHLHAHAKFDGSSYDYDIALIRIGNRLKVVGNKFVVDSQASSGSLTFTRYIRPVCLPCMKGHPFSPVNILERYDTNLCSRNIRGNNPNIPVRAGDETMVTGFGWKRSSGFVHWDKPKVMQEGRLKVQKDEKCINSVKLMQKEDKSARYTDRMICAKSADKSKNIDACEGDSGGPLVKRFGIQHSRYWMQVGIVSWGWGCGNEHPGFYTSLSSVMDWVWSVLNKTKTDSCSKPSAYEHSSSIARKEVYRVGEVITFSCNQGYAMSGNPDITCQSDLTWSLPQFLCTVVNCGQPHIPRNGYIKGESYLSGDWVEYYCDQGFRFTVSNATYRRRCMSSGVWSGESINCESEVLCPIPNIISGTIKGSEPFKVGSIVSFVCNDGYKMSGYSSATCSENGLWNPPPPKCTRKVNQNLRCEYQPHKVPPNRSCRKSCKTDEDCQSSRKTCNCDDVCGMTCFNLDAECVQLHKRIQNGRVKYLNETRSSMPYKPIYGSVAEYVCNRGSILEGQQTRKCQSDRRWSGVAPKCKVILPDCFSIHIANDGIIDTKSKDIEIYFLVDLSNNVDLFSLRGNIEFASSLVERLSQSDIKDNVSYGVIAFATKAKIIINMLDLPKKSHSEVIMALKNLQKDIESIRKTIYHGSNYDEALRLINMRMIAFSFVMDEELTTRRHIILLTSNVCFTTSGYAMRIENSYSPNPPKFYVVSSPKGSIHKNDLEQLTTLASKKRNFILIQDFYKMHLYVDQFTDARTDYSQCGQAGDIKSIKMLATRGRVLGGQNAATGAWPWQALITTYDENILRAFNEVLGGGSLINDKWVLTVAHMFGTFSGINWEKGIMVSLGITRRPQRYNMLEGSVKMFQPEKIYIHDEYEKYNGKYIHGSFQNDIALIKLGGEFQLSKDGRHLLFPDTFPGYVELTPYIKPVCLPCSQDSCVSQILMRKDIRGNVLLNGYEKDEEKCKIEYEFLMEGNSDTTIAVVATGFGFNSTRRSDSVYPLKTTPELQQALLKVNSRKECEDAVKIINRQMFIPGFEQIFTDQMFCAVGFAPGRGKIIDTCNGDNGGPVVRQVFDNLTKKSCFVQLGIVSWGYGCGQQTIINGKQYFYPGFYTDVTSLMSWITNTVRNHEQKNRRSD
ncbi:sushi, von Willebrand factor type A, EGF and pentraxin domain-containing protein 1-like isoform X2 [Styela clava]